MLETWVELENNCTENDIAIAQLLQKQEYNRRKRKEGIGILGLYELLMKELRTKICLFLNSVRVELEPAMFREMLARLGPRITKEDT